MEKDTSSSETEPGKENDVSISDLPVDSVKMPDPWDGKSRVNLLFMGLDYRDWEAGEVPKTDTMILFSFDPISNSLGMVSIPRDLWISIPGFEYNKINMAYFFGESWKMPGGGPELAKKTVEELLGVPIQYYAQLDFSAFVSFIDHIDGVKITIPEEITVYRLGHNSEVTLEPGTVTLPGDLALAYARARNTEGVDFDRARRQQQIIIGVLDRITEFQMMPKLVANADELYNDLSAGISTNLSLNEGIRLALKVLEIPKDNIKNTVIGGEYVTIEKSPNQLDILRPIPDKIRLLRDEFFSGGIAVGPAAVASDLIELAKLENASIAVYNGSSHDELASKTAEYLKSQGLTVVEESNTDYTVYSQVYLMGSKPYTLKYLAEMVTIPSNRIYNRYDPNAQVEIQLILGDDWAANNLLP